MQNSYSALYLNSVCCQLATVCNRYDEWSVFIRCCGVGGGFYLVVAGTATGQASNAGADTFKYSIVYLMALFVIMLLDHYFFPVTIFP